MWQESALPTPTVSRHPFRGAVTSWGDPMFGRGFIKSSHHLTGRAERREYPGSTERQTAGRVHSEGKVLGVGSLFNYSAQPRLRLLYIAHLFLSSTTSKSKLLIGALEIDKST